MDIALSFIHTPCLLAAPILVHQLTRNYPTTKLSNYQRNYQTIRCTRNYPTCKTIKLAINYSTLYKKIMKPGHQADWINGHSFIIHTHTLLACCTYTSSSTYKKLFYYQTIQETIKLFNLQETIQLVKLSNQQYTIQHFTIQ